MKPIGNLQPTGNTNIILAWLDNLDHLEPLTVYYMYNLIESYHASIAIYLFRKYIHVVLKKICMNFIYPCNRNLKSNHC